MLALRRTALDLEAAVMKVGASLEQTKQGLRIKETKGRRIRRVGLDEETVSLLKQVLERQEANRSLFGESYRADLDLVFCHPNGDFIRPDVVTKAARLLAKKAGLAGVSLHTMRHSHGSQLLSLGVPLPTVSKRLGHANTNVTATIYAHALPNDEAATAEIWGKGMKVASQSRPKVRVIRDRKSA